MKKPGIHARWEAGDGIRAVSVSEAKKIVARAAERMRRLAAEQRRNPREAGKP